MLTQQSMEPLDLTYLRKGTRILVRPLIRNDIELRVLSDAISRELEESRLENEKYRDKVEELEKWILLLTNNFYAGHPSSIEAVRKGLVTVDEQR